MRGEPGVRGGLCEVDGVRGEEEEEDVAVGGVEFLAGEEGGGAGVGEAGVETVVSLGSGRDG